MTRLPSQWTYAGWFSVLRIYAGVFWLAHGIPKFLNAAAFLPPSGYMADAVQRGLQTHHGAYHVFLATVVAPNIALFAELVRLGEVLTGCALLLGIFTRFAGLVGCILTFNYFTNNGGFGTWTSLGSLDAIAFVLSFTFLVIPAGRLGGIDALLGRRKRAVPVAAPREGVVIPEFVDEPPPQAPPG